MNAQEFDRNVSRLGSRWKNVYVDEFKAILWKELGMLPPGAFERICTKLIGEERQAPLMAEFRREAAVERERQWAKEKQEHKQDSKEFWHGTSTDEERTMMFQAIRSRIKGEMPDADWKCFLTLLDTRFPA